MTAARLRVRAGRAVGAAHRHAGSIRRGHQDGLRPGRRRGRLLQAERLGVLGHTAVRLLRSLHAGLDAQDRAQAVQALGQRLLHNPLLRPVVQHIGAFPLRHPEQRVDGDIFDLLVGARGVHITEHRHHTEHGAIDAFLRLVAAPQGALAADHGLSLVALSGASGERPQQQQSQLQQQGEHAPLDLVDAAPLAGMVDHGPDDLVELAAGVEQELVWCQDIHVGASRAWVSLSNRTTNG